VGTPHLVAQDANLDLHYRLDLQPVELVGGWAAWAAWNVQHALLVPMIGGHCPSVLSASPVGLHTTAPGGASVTCPHIATSTCQALLPRQQLQVQHRARCDAAARLAFVADMQAVDAEVAKRNNGQLTATMDPMQALVAVVPGLPPP
jgi:hypothetical protein